MSSLTVLIMGVSGSGKSTVGALLARGLGLRFVDGDSLHSESNRRKMAAGIPLSDADREPWLAAVAVLLANGGVVVACSALRRSYRDRLRFAAPDLKLVYLRGSRDLLRQRVTERKHEFMPPALLDSQLAMLEPPEADEHAIVADVALAPDVIVRAVIAALEGQADTG
jgi:carbohydrate kinase (thermoresistant glucokinase family)